MTNFEEIRNYAKARNIKFTVHRDDTISVRYTKKHNNNMSHMQYAKSISRKLEKLGYEYISKNDSFKWYDYPNVVINIRFRRSSTC